VKGQVQEMVKTGAVVLLALGIVGGMEWKVAGAGNQAFGFGASLISGFPGGRAAEMTGGGAYNLDRISAGQSFVNSGGGFRCLSNITAGLFTGCQAGQGVRWDTAALLGSTMFQCTGSDTAKIIVSDSDLDPVAEGVQNVWIQSIGCATDAVVSFN
jgi:hypothetical protein